LSGTVSAVVALGIVAVAVFTVVRAVRIVPQATSGLWRGSAATTGR
jgi:hypothetical protein